MMKEAGTILFRDAESMEEGVAIVRYNDSSVALCLSLRSDGDIEVVMKKDDAKKLLDALKRSTA